MSIETFFVTNLSALQWSMVVMTLVFVVLLALARGSDGEPCMVDEWELYSRCAPYQIPGLGYLEQAYGHGLIAMVEAQRQLSQPLDLSPGATNYILHALRCRYCGSPATGTHCSSCGGPL
jgi:hypothetical protein